MANLMVEDTTSEDDQLAAMTTEDIIRATRLLDNKIRVHKEEMSRTNLELDSYKEKIKENQEKIKLNKQLPYLVGNIVEILEMNPEDEAEEDGANIDLDSQRKGKCVVLKTSTRQTIFLPVVGLVDPDTLKPGDLVGVNKDSYLILDTLPSEYDSRVKAMEVDEKPTEDYNDIGGLEKQASFIFETFSVEAVMIQELVEAIVLPMTHSERFQKLGIRPPKGVLLYGPPGTGKTLMARACAAQTNATFLKLAGPQLVQMFIGDGAKLVRDAFLLAKEKSPCIIFIDEIDAIGTKRFDSEVSGDREVQRTMLELLNQLDGFSSDDRIKVIAATNRADILDPALVRSGRLDRKIELPHPTEEARARILQIHSRKMNVHPDVNFEELARSTDDFNGAQLKAVCVEAGMLALRRDATEVNHEDFNEGIIQLAAMSTEDIVRATRLLDNEIRILKEEMSRTNLELDSYKEKIKENQEKIKLNKQLPYLVGNIVEILEMNPEDEAEEDGANIDLDSQRKGKCVVLKTSTRQTIFLPVVGLVDPDKLKPGDLVGVNKDSYLILDTLPSEYDSRIQELVEAIVLPMTHQERFQKLGVRPPKGVLLYGPPGTGKTLMARACAAQTNATFLKLAGPQLVQMFIGDGAKLVRDAFQLAKEKSPCIIFIDEIDAIGTKRFDSEVSGDREVQRTMLELLNQLDGFSSDDRIKQRPIMLHNQLRFDDITNFVVLMQIHSRKMNVNPDVNFEELARSTDDFNGAQLKAVCVEAGMLALRRDATEVNHEDFNEGIIQVQAKKKASLNYYA
ncbi:hypothetical protein DVH24_015159 [Malus domestica]|uniref:AAA+ ATPase domain-containing protein n=1 Tax=Malus domestica TaxID=3750 RepID=A0A498K0X5_MALDO|nr:hypothetical protein DVH24_015159 [Malus domestica]